MEPTERTQIRPDGTTFTPKLVDGMEFLQQWRRENLSEFDQVVEYQEDQMRQALATQAEANANKSKVQADGLSAPDDPPVQTTNDQEPPH